MIYKFDYDILKAIQNIRCNFLDVVMPFFSTLGDKGLLWILIGFTLIMFKKTRTMGTCMLLALSLEFILCELIIKNIFDRPRPFLLYNDILPLIKEPKTFSFPSGHTASSFACSVAMLMYNKKVGIFALILAVLISFSRLYNCVHFPTDVIVGAILGILCAVFTYFAFRKFNLEKRLYKKITFENIGKKEK